MRIAVLNETSPGERRVALVPESCKKLIATGYVISTKICGSDQHMVPGPHHGAIRLGPRTRDQGSDAADRHLSHWLPRCGDCGCGSRIDRVRRRRRPGRARMRGVVPVDRHGGRDSRLTIFGKKGTCT
jgi:hypothetical protein